MQASDALPPTGEPWQANGRGPAASTGGSAMSPAAASVISPATSAYGFGGHMESPSLSQAGGEDEAEAEAAKRRTNPLIDLIESEKRYVDELGMVIRVRRPLVCGRRCSFNGTLGRASPRSIFRADPGHRRRSLPSGRSLALSTEGGRRMVAAELSAATPRPDVPVDRGRVQDQPRLWLRASLCSPLWRIRPCTCCSRH
jgi:hypothetical protein